MHDNTQHLYNNLDLRKLLIPIIVEQLLSSLMGTADTMMVSNVALPQFLPFPWWIPSIFLSFRHVCLICRGRDPVLPVSRQPEQKRCQPFCSAGFVCHGHSVCNFIRFLSDIPWSAASCNLWKVERDVMTNSRIYFFFTLLSFPFIGLYDAGASIMRSQNNSRNPMIISVISNLWTLAECDLIFVLGMGVEGAAISTLVITYFLCHRRYLAAAQWQCPDLYPQLFFHPPRLVSD